MFLFSQKYLNLDKKLLKVANMLPNFAPWCSNREWCSLCADAVGNFQLTVNTCTINTKVCNGWFSATIISIKVTVNIVCFIVAITISNYWMKKSSFAIFLVKAFAFSTMICNKIGATVPAIEITVSIVCFIIAKTITNQW